jgi:hypothetical protein
MRLSQGQSRRRGRRIQHGMVRLKRAEATGATFSTVRTTAKKANTQQLEYSQDGWLRFSVRTRGDGAG